MKCIVLALLCAGLVATTTVVPEGVVSTINMYGHGYKTIGVDPFFRFGGSDVYNPFASAVSHESVHSFFNPYFVSPSGKVFRRFTVRDLFEMPMVLLIKSAEKDGHLTQVYAEKGLRTVLSDPTFKPIVDYFRSPVEKSGIIFDAKTFYHTRLFDAPISSMVVPKHFKVTDVTKFLVHADDIPVVIIMDKADFERVKVDSITDIAKLGVFDTTIEPISEPIIPLILRPIH